MTSEQRVKQVYPDAQAIWTSRGWRVLARLGMTCGVEEIGRTSSGHVPESDVWDDAASKLPAEPQQAERGGEKSALDWLNDALGFYQVTHIHSCIRSAIKAMDLVEVSAPSPQPTEQTFEEWWETYRPEPLNHYGEAAARAAWNAAKGGRDVQA